MRDDEIRMAPQKGPEAGVRQTSVYVDEQDKGIFYLAFDLLLVRVPVRGDGTFNTAEGQGIYPSASDTESWDDLYISEVGAAKIAYLASVRAELLDAMVWPTTDAATERALAQRLRQLAQDDWDLEGVAHVDSVSSDRVRMLDLGRGRQSLP